MTTATLDALRYYERLQAAGVLEKQAKIQAGAMRNFSMKEMEGRLLKEMAPRLLKWQWGKAFALAAIMAKGFHLPGF